jgi:hypothetical protein
VGRPRLKTWIAGNFTLQWLTQLELALNSNLSLKQSNTLDICRLNKKVFKQMFTESDKIYLPGENQRPVKSHWQTLSHYVVSSTPRHEWGSNSQLYWGLAQIAQELYHTIMTTMAPRCEDFEVYFIRFGKHLFKYFYTNFIVFGLTRRVIEHTIYHDSRRAL